MNLETAPTVVREPFACDHCGRGTYVLYEYEKVCPDCGYLAGTKEDPEPDHPWFKWRVIRNTRYEDEDDPVDRRKVVGSYAHAYYDEDGNVVI